MDQIYLFIITFFGEFWGKMGNFGESFICQVLIMLIVKMLESIYNFYPYL